MDSEKLNMNTSDQLTYSTVQLSCLNSDGTIITGTGFFVKYDIIACSQKRVQWKRLS